MIFRQQVSGGGPLSPIYLGGTETEPESVKIVEANSLTILVLPFRLGTVSRILDRKWLALECAKVK